MTEIIVTPCAGDFAHGKEKNHVWIAVPRGWDSDHPIEEDGTLQPLLAYYQAIAELPTYLNFEEAEIAIYKAGDKAIRSGSHAYCGECGRNHTLEI